MIYATDPAHRMQDARLLKTPVVPGEPAPPNPRNDDDTHNGDNNDGMTTN